VTDCYLRGRSAISLLPSHCPKTKPSIIGYNKKTLKTLLDLIKGMVKECGTDEEDKMGQNGSFPDYEEDIHIIMKNMADHLNDVKHMLPEEQQESIEYPRLATAQIR